MSSKQQAVELAQQNAEQFRGDFPAWLGANFAVYEKFESHARIVAQKRKHYSARTIAEFIRHNSVTREHGDGYKLNNDRVPCMVRLFALLNPQHATLFEFRVSDSRGRAAA